MSYFVTVTFDIKNGTPQDYANVLTELNSIGLYENIIGGSNTTSKLPSNTFAGEFNGLDLTSVRDDICNRIQSIFRKCKVKSEIFVAVGGDWGWGIRTT